MTIGVLLVSHELLGQVMLDISVKTLNVCPLATRVLSVPLNDDPDALAARAEKMIAELNSGDGVLILTDLCGATPSNIACRFAHLDDVTVVAGLNLPMLIRVLNYPKLSLSEIAQHAVDGGHRGIMQIPNCDEVC
jgi:mannose PTS system EIIA component